VSAPPRVDPSWPVLTTDWTAQLSSLLMGTKTPFMIQSIDGLGLPLARSVDVPRAGADGSFSGQDFASSRDVILIMDVVPLTGSGQTLAGLISAFTQAWAARTVDVGLSLCIPGWGPIVLIGRPRKGEASFDLVAGRGTMIALQALFTAVDPRKYGATLKSVQANYPTSGVGTGLPFNAASYLGMSFAPLRYLQNPDFNAPTIAPWTAANTGVSGWYNAGATLSRDTGTVHSGAASGKVITTGTPQGINQQITPLQLLAGQTYSFSCWLYLATAGGALRVVLWDGSEQAVNPVLMSTVGSWVQVSGTFTVVTPGNNYLMVYDTGSNVARTFYVDDVQIGVGSGLPTFVPVSQLMGATFGPTAAAVTSTGLQYCTNAGSQSTAPFTRIVAGGGSVTGPIHLERVESGDEIVLNINLNPGDLLELDHDLHSVTYNGTSNRADVVDQSSVWWWLQPGLNTIRFRTEGPGAGSYAQVSWRDAFW
jgi:hypothetical protein